MRVGAGTGVGAGVESDLDAARLWWEFADPGAPGDDDGNPTQVVRADLTWLTSSWNCTFGRGCPGVVAGRADDGCCTLGAHFSEPADEARVARAVARLTPGTWQYATTHADAWAVDDDEEPDDRRTAVVDGACVLLNRPGWAASGPGRSAGCALHALALAEGREPLQLKPDVCWQLPLRRTYRTVERPDGTEYLEVSVGEYDRRGWGPGGLDLDRYCTGDPQAHRGATPVVDSLRAELVELLGAPAYTVLAEACHALLRRRLPFAVHPATVAAASAEQGGDGA